MQRENAELAQILAPRPFLAGRGRRDGIAFFNGPHRVDGPAALEFLRRFLGR